MISRALFGLLFRRSLAVTLGIIAVLTAAIVYMRQVITDPGRTGEWFFLIVFNALAYGLLVSLGGFLGQVTSELGAVRLARLLPGLRRKINESVVLLVPVVALLALLFLQATVPEHFETIDPGTQWSLNVFLVCLGLGLGSSWLLYGILAVILVKLGFVLEHLRLDPIRSCAVAFGGAGVLLVTHRRRFLTPLAGTEARWFGLLSWFSLPLAGVVQPRRTEKLLRDGPDWVGSGSRATGPNLVAAGAYERLGRRRGLFPGKVLLSAALVYGTFGLLVWIAAGSGKYPGTMTFFVEVFTAEMARQQAGIMRVLFAAIFGCMAFVCAVVLDTSLLPTLWHPISRRLRGRSVFLSHLRQNVVFAAVYAAVAVLLVVGFGRYAGAPFSWTALSAFLLPPAIGVILAPIPQALFPNGAEVFRRKADPLTQLLAGLTGGLFCLLTIYWTAYWPLKGWHEQLAPLTRGGLLVAAGLVVYAVYYSWLRRHYDRADFSRRSG